MNKLFDKDALLRVMDPEKKMTDDKDGWHWIQTINRCPVPGCGSIPILVWLWGDNVRHDHGNSDGPKVWTMCCGSEIKALNEHGSTDGLEHPFVHVQGKLGEDFYNELTDSWNKATHQWVLDKGVQMHPEITAEKFKERAWGYLRTTMTWNGATATWLERQAIINAAGAGTATNRDSCAHILCSPWPQRTA